MMKSLLKNNYLKFTIPLTLLLITASGFGFFSENAYILDHPNFASQAVGQDLITLVIGAPLLAISGYLAAKGSTKSAIIWLGVLLYTFYTYAVAAFHVQFNSLFLVYVGLLGGSLYGMIFGFIQLNSNELEIKFPGKSSNKAIGIFLICLAVLFYLLWGSEIIPAVTANNTPASVIEVELPTSAVHVLDLAVVLPAMIIAAVFLLKDKSIGYPLAGMMLTYGALLGLAIISMVIFMGNAGFTVSVPQIVIFSTVTIGCIGFLIALIRGRM